ncbi:MAG: 30S ribosome-binding factor RbfA [Anaerolineae bacterium]|nr:MAG: 30S ribosome-binding factor RbfA [Anaerolineae bacterium]
MPSSIRLQKIADRIREEMSELLLREISDPRLHQIFVTDVRVDRELAYADVYVSAVEGKSRAADVLAGLESANGFLRRALATRVELRVFPRLRFHWDPTPENADHIEKLLRQLREERKE